MSNSDSPLRAALGRWWVPLLAVGVATAVFLIAPIAIILSTSFSGGDFLEFPPSDLSLRWYDEIVTDPDWRSSFLLSLRIALLATLLATVAGTSAALALRRLRPSHAAWARAVFIAPIVLPYVVYALGLFNLFDGMRLIGATWPIAVGHAVLAFPLVFVTVSVALTGVDPALGRAATSLGARWPEVVWRVELPLIRWSVVAAAVLAFAFSFDEVVVALFLAAPEAETLPVGIFRAALDTASPSIAAVSTLVTVFAVLLAVAAFLVTRPSRRLGGGAR